ncbi:MAG: portal protein [Gammaproteobacteria bacterium]|nr:portal protein [Gammaproteobacteria bacterium]
MRNLVAIQERAVKLGVIDKVPAIAKDQALREAGYINTKSSERGLRSTPENMMVYANRFGWVDPSLRAAILDIRKIDKDDGRVKTMHRKMSRTAVKGGLKLDDASNNKKLSRLWKSYKKRLNLHKHEKLESDASGLVKEGNLCMQWVVDMESRTLQAGIRMPTETINPVVNPNGQFKSIEQAYEQFDLTTGKVTATFSLYQMSIGRLTPDNYDDRGSMGRPYLDAARKKFNQLIMTEDAMVLRRHSRAPLRMSHSLEGVTEPELLEYKARVEADQMHGNTNDYYSNKKSSVTPVQGDASLGEVADVMLLLDGFFAGGPAPKGLFGYVDGLNRDILEDLKKDYFDEIDALQDIQAQVYDFGFRLDLLLKGINPDKYDFEVKFAERKTDTANQRADLALKHKALGMGDIHVWTVAGEDPAKILKSRQAQINSNDPYPSDLEVDFEEESANTPNISVTPGNQKKGESATDITTRSN